jgi:DNA polymerase-3 subunit beta
MKIQFNRTEFSEALSVVSRAVSAKSTIPALEGILIRASQGKVSLCGYDLDTGITTQIEARVEEPGEIVLSARVLFDIVKRMPGELVRLQSDAKGLTELKSGVAEFSILGMPAEEFPELPQVTETVSVTLEQSILRSMIEQTLFAVAQSDAKPVHTGTLFDLSGDAVTLVSVDGYRLALRQEQVKTGKPIRFIVPGKTLSEIVKILSDGEGTVELQLAKRHVLFHIGCYSVLSRLLEGDFLDYATAIPKGATTVVEAGTRELVDSIERTSLLISDRIKSPLRVKFGEEKISLSCFTSLGKAYDEIEGLVNGPPVEMGFNNRYLLDALRACGCDKIRLEISGALSPMKVLPLKGENFVFLVLPVRLKSE